MKRLCDGASGSNPAPVKRVFGVSVTLERTVFEIFIFWLVDRSRVHADGSMGGHAEEFCPWWLVQQAVRTLHPRKPSWLRNLIHSQEPCYGILVGRLDWEIWSWFLHTSKDSPFEWYRTGEEPVDVHTNEYLEISGLNLRGDYNAFKKFPDLNE